jgi:hypothetical protein
VAIGLLFNPKLPFFVRTTHEFFYFISQLLFPNQKDELPRRSLTATKPPMFDLLSTELKRTLVEGARLGVVPLMLMLFEQIKELWLFLGKGRRHSVFSFIHSVLFYNFNEISITLS